MDLRSYIELKEAYINMMRPQTEVVSEEVEVVEEEILNEFDTSEADGIKPKTNKNKRPTGGDPMGLTSDKYNPSKPSKPRNKPDNIFTRAQTEVDKANRKATNDARAVFGKPPVGKPKVTGPKGPGGASDGSGRGQAQQTKPKGDLLSTLAKGGSKAAQDVKSKLSKSGSGSSGSGGGSRPTGGGSSRPTSTPAAKPPSKPTPKPAPKPQDKNNMGANMRAWSKANPNLAKKVKPGQSGYKAINPQSKPSAGASAAMSAAKPAPKPNVNGMKSGRLATALSSVKKFKAEETIMNDFDIILEHLVEQGFPIEEALKLMVNMPGEKQEQILENRRAARSAGGYVDDSKKQTDPSKDGFTGISGSIKDIMRQNKEIEAKNKKKTKKEEMDSLSKAYLSVFSEEESDKEKDSHLERGGHAARTDYDKAPKGTGPMSDEEKEKSKKASMSALEKVKAEFMAKHGKGAIIDTKKKKED